MPPRTADNLREDILGVAANDPERAYCLVMPLEFKADGGSRRAACCPFHQEKTPSFKLTLMGEYAGHWKCHSSAGCGGGDLFAFAAKAWGLSARDDFPAIKRRLAGLYGLQMAEANGNATREAGRTSYEIRDETGQLWAVHHRIDFDNGTKRVWWERNGAPNLGGLQPGVLPLYNTHLLEKAPTDARVCICEGEKAADALSARGVLALATFGTTATPDAAALICLTGRLVTLWPDNDKNGREHMDAVGALLAAQGDVPKVVTWTAAPPKGDAADFGGSDADLVALLNAAKPWQVLVSPAPVDPAQAAAEQAVRDLARMAAEVQHRAAEKPADPEYILGPLRQRLVRVEKDLVLARPLHTVRASELMSDLVKTRWYWEGWLARGYLHIMGGAPELGKSAAALYVAGAVMGLTPYPRGQAGEVLDGTVLWYDTEGAHNLLLERMDEWGFDDTRFALPGTKGHLESLRIDIPWHIEDMRRRVETEGATLVVIDSLRTAHESNSNDEQVGRLLRNVAEVARDLAVPILVLHHPTKLRFMESPKMTLDRLSGSGTIGAMARVVWGVWIEDAEEDETATLAVIKSNLAKKPKAVGYTQTDYAFPEWCDAPVRQGYASKSDACGQWLQQALRGGARPVDDIIAEAKVAGFGATVVRNTREALELWVGVRNNVNCWGLRSR